MNKLTALFLVICILASVSIPCLASTAETEAVSTEPKRVQIDEGLSLVYITFPASFFGDEDMSSFDPDEYVTENGFEKAVINEDGSIVVTMSMERHEELLEETAKSLEESFAEMIGSENTPYIKEIDHTENFETVTVKVVKAEYEKAFDMTPLIIGISAMMYQMLLDMDYHVEINIVDFSSGDILYSAIYPDVFG